MVGFILYNGIVLCNYFFKNKSYKNGCTLLQENEVFDDMCFLCKLSKLCYLTVIQLYLYLFVLPKKRLFLFTPKTTLK